MTKIKLKLNNVLHPSHGPQIWPWYYLFSFHLCALRVYYPSTSYRLWIYTRWGSRDIDITFYRRS